MKSVEEERDLEASKEEVGHDHAIVIDTIDHEMSIGIEVNIASALDPPKKIDHLDTKIKIIMVHFHVILKSMFPILIYTCIYSISYSYNSKHVQ